MFAFICVVKSVEANFIPYSPWAQIPNLEYRYHSGWIILLGIFELLYDSILCFDDLQTSISYSLVLVITSWMYTVPFLCQIWCQSNELLESYRKYFTHTPLKVSAPFGVDNCLGYFWEWQLDGGYYTSWMGILSVIRHKSDKKTCCHYLFYAHPYMFSRPFRRNGICRWSDTQNLN